MEHIDRRSFLNATSRFAAGALTAGAFSEVMRPDDAWAQQAATVPHPASARVLDRLRTRFMFQISVDVGTMELGLSVAGGRARGRRQHRRNGDAAAQEPGRRERRAGLPQEVSRRAPAGRHEDDGRRCLRGARRLYGRRQYLRFPRARRRQYGESDLWRARRVQAQRSRSGRDSSFATSWSRTRARPRRPARPRFA